MPVKHETPEQAGATVTLIRGERPKREMIAYERHNKPAHRYTLWRETRTPVGPSMRHDGALWEWSMRSAASPSELAPMPVAEIKAAVDAGKTVHWSSIGYTVKRDARGEYLIVFGGDGNAIGLTHADGVTLNGHESDFFIAPN